MLGVFAAVLLASITIPKLKLSKNINYAGITAYSSQSLKGLLCLMIFFNHFTGWFLDFDPVTYLLVHCGSQVVAAFFFLSSYGLSKKYLGKEISIKFLIKRFTKLLIPYWICELIYCVVSVFANIPIKVDINLKNIVIAFFAMVDKSEIVENGWFVTAIAFMYISWFFLSKIFKGTKMSLKFLILIVVFSVITKGMWITSSLAFPLGIFIAENESKIKKISNKTSALILVILFILTAIGITAKFYGQYYDKSFIMDLSDTCTAVSIVVIFYMFIMHASFGNKILFFLGKISYEYYLLHGLMIRISYKIWGLERPLLFCITAIVLCIIVSYVVNYLAAIIGRYINGKAKLSLPNKSKS